VSGTIWLAANPLALRSVVFRFEHLEGEEARSGAGGRISFKTMDNGQVVVDDWRLEIPPASAPGVIVIIPATQVEGGSLLSASWPDGTAFHRPLGTVVGSVRRARGGDPLSGVTVLLLGSPYAATTAADGTFSFAAVFPARYTVTAIDSTWVSFGVNRRTSMQVGVSERGVVQPQLVLEDPEVLTQRRCDAEGLPKGPAMVVGRVIDEAGAPVASTVSVRLKSEAGGDSFSTSPAGEFWLCGLRPTELIVSARSQNASGETTTTLTDSAVTRVTITVRR
jgi:hypothetical protein